MALEVVVGVLLVYRVERVKLGLVPIDLGWVDTVRLVLVLQVVVKEVDLLLVLQLLKSGKVAMESLGSAGLQVLCLGCLIRVQVLLLGSQCLTVDLCLDL